MNKLVSKNPIQRFKQGKKILKAGEGLGLNDPYISRGNRLKSWLKETFSDWNPYTGFVRKSNPANPQQQQQTTIPNNSSNNNQQQQTTDYSWMKGGTRQRTAEEKAKLNDSAVQKYLNRQQSPTTKPTTTGPKTISKQPTNNSMFLAKQGGWNKSIGLGNINDQESKDILNKLGWKDKTAEQVQQLLNSNNTGGYAVNVDNKWGNQSKDALKKYYERYLKEQQINPPTDPIAINLDQAYQSQKPSNQPSAFPKIEMPYTSTGTYNLDNSRTLKTLGIKDYNSLLDFIEKNPGSAIASDLKQRFGETSGWNQQNIENEIGIGGHYGRMNRNALWGYLSGLKNKYNQDYARKLGMMMLGYNKQGGQLVSRNPVKRFKNKKK